MTENHTNEADYYHARAADMMAKAQAAPSKATRIAYLNLAQTWARKAAALEQEWLRSQVSVQKDAAGPAAAERKN